MSADRTVNQKLTEIFADPAVEEKAEVSAYEIFNSLCRMKTATIAAALQDRIERGEISRVIRIMSDDKQRVLFETDCLLNVPDSVQDPEQGGSFISSIRNMNISFRLN